MWCEVVVVVLAMITVVVVVVKGKSRNQTQRPLADSRCICPLSNLSENIRELRSRGWLFPQDTSHVARVALYRRRRIVSRLRQSCQSPETTPLCSEVYLYLGTVKRCLGCAQIRETCQFYCIIAFNLIQGLLLGYFWYNGPTPRTDLRQFKTCYERTKQPATELAHLEFDINVAFVSTVTR